MRSLEIGIVRFGNVEKPIREAFGAEFESYARKVVAIIPRLL